VASEQAQQFLDRLHENVWRGLGRTPRAQSKEDEAAQARIKADAIKNHVDSLPANMPPDMVASTLNGLSEFEARLAATPISKYEDPYTIGLLWHKADLMEEAARRHAFRLPERPLLGTLPTGQINAMTVLVPRTDEHIVLFESQLFMFTHLTAQAVAEVVPYVEQEDGSVIYSTNAAAVEERIEHHPEATRRFGEVIRAYLETLQPGFAAQFDQSAIRGTFAAALSDSAEMFVLGHEYGHVLKGHLGQRNPVSRFSETGSTRAEVEEIRYSQRQELEADIEGLQLMLPPQQVRWGVPLSYASVDFFFTMMDVFDQAISVLRHGEDLINAAVLEQALSQLRGDGDGNTRTTHPAPVVRREFLRHVFGKSAARDARVSNALEMAGQLQAIVELLWSRLRSALLDAHRAGVRPLDIWTD
jgi:hypothetical protein